MTTPAVVYRAYDADGGALLYIGSTVNLTGRLKAHASAAGAPWWIGNLRITTEDFPSRAAAHDAERYAILAEHPRWNIQWRCEAHPDGRLVTMREVAMLHPHRETAQFRMSYRRSEEYLTRFRVWPRCPLKDYGDEIPDGIQDQLAGVTIEPHASDPSEKVSA